MTRLALPSHLADAPKKVRKAVERGDLAALETRLRRLASSGAVHTNVEQTREAIRYVKAQLGSDTEAAQPLERKMAGLCTMLCRPT